MKRTINKTGQHIIEYSVVVILVSVGIIIMGPYVVRSWNAYVKGLEDSVEESLVDPINTAVNAEDVFP